MDQNQSFQGRLAKFANADLEVQYPGVLKSENAGKWVSDCFESFSKPNIHIATSPWNPSKNKILNVYVEHLEISLWVLFESNSAALLNRIQVITASPELYWHGADRKKSHQCLASTFNCIWLKHTFAGSMYSKNHADVIFKMLKWIGLSFLLLLKYESMLLHLKNLISVSRDLFETVTKAKEQLYNTSTGKKRLFFPPKYMENPWFLILLQLIYYSFNLAIKSHMSEIYVALLLPKLLLLCSLIWKVSKKLKFGSLFFPEQDDRIRIPLTLLWLGLHTQLRKQPRKGCSE